MQRIAIGVISFAFLAAAIGCDNKKSDMGGNPSQGDSSSYGGGSSYSSGASTANSGPATGYYGPDGNSSYSTYDEYAADTGAGSGSYSASVASGSTGGSRGGQMHTVGKGDTLYSISRTYYGNQSKWKVIYEANRNRISNPNSIRVGEQLIIP